MNTALLLLLLGGCPRPAALHTPTEGVAMQVLTFHVDGMEERDGFL